MSSLRQTAGNCQPWFEIDLVLSNLFYFLPAKEILACHAVSRTWARTLLNTSDDNLQYWKWKMILSHTWPHFGVDSKKMYSGKTLRESYELRRLLEDKILPELWSPDFSQEFKYGKYSRWVCDYKSPKFILDIVCILQILSSFGPKEYLLLDGADKSKYNPSHSTTNSDSPGWRLHRNQEELQRIETENILKLNVDAYGAMIICRAICTHRWYQSGIEYEDVFNAMVVDISSLWGEDTEKNRKNFFEKFPVSRRRRHMNISAVVMSSCGWYEKERLKEETTGKALDIVKNTKLLAFLLYYKESLNSVFWDVDGVTCRGIEHLAEKKFNRWHNEMYNGMQIHIRQYPPMFNMFKLVHHVDTNFSWRDILSLFVD